MVISAIKKYSRNGEKECQVEELKYKARSWKTSPRKKA